MEAATKLLPRRRAERSARELEQLRPLGEAFLMRRFSAQLPRADAEEAVSDVIIRLHRRIEAGRPPNNLRAAFFTSVRNAAIDQFRSRQARPTVGLELVEETPSEARAPLELAEAREDAARLQDALLRMRPNYREAIVLRFGAGLTVPELAERLHISLPAAKKLVLRATAQVRKRLMSIESHEFCPEMRERAKRSLFDREAAGLAGESERRALQAHFRHCGSCKAFLAALHQDLHELGGSLLVATAAGEGAGIHLGIGDHLSRWLGHASDSAHVATAKLRLAAYKAGGALTGAEAGCAGALGAGAQKALAVCGAATATAATCLARGVIGPGLGVTADHAPSSSANAPAAAAAESTPAAEQSPAVEYSPAPPAQPEPTPAPEPAPAASQAAAPSASERGEEEPAANRRPSPSQQASEQFGFESSSASSESTPPPEPAPEPAPEPQPTPAPEPSTASAPTSAGGSSSSSSAGGSAEGGEHFGFSG